MADGNLEARVDGIDAELSETYTMVHGAYLPSVAVACALIEKGVLSKNELLSITDTLISMTSAGMYDVGTGPEDATAVLGHFRETLEALRLRRGAVLHELQTLEQGAAEELKRRRRLHMRRSGPDQGQGGETGPSEDR